jgi:glycosyltransferase involved in cell wall biosynthesis
VRARNAVKYALLGRLTSRILCVSPDLAARARRLGAPARAVRFFPNAIDAAAFAPPTEAERAAARAALGLSPDALALLHFGWDWHGKGGDLFLDAVAQLRAAGRPAVAVTVGAGEEARMHGDRLGLGDALLVLPPTGEAGRLRAAVDVFVASSRAEGMPFSVAEALASGLPVVATDLPGQRIQCEGLDACRLTGLDGGEIAAAVASLADRAAAVAAADAEAARRTTAERLDLGPWSRRLLELYDEALAG